MKPLYAARLEGLGPGDLVHVECVCSHSERLTASMLTTAGIKPYEGILGLQHRMRCRECDQRAKVVVTIRWSSS